MKKVKKFFKVTTLCLVTLFIFLSIFCVCYYHITTSSYSLNDALINSSKMSVNLKIYDAENNPITLSSENYISINKLSQSTKNAFISAEDKRFYQHHGIDYIRLARATMNNLKSKSFKQGASTISQQLIKNTHLSNEKTIKRKLRELKLTKGLEKKYSKNEILELYLNNIYFGNGCYGIENASNHYFSKSASELTLAESALLAGTINAPSIYDVEKNSEKALTRRNLILALMKNYGKISEEEFETAKNEKLNLKLTKLSNNNYIWGKILEEACKITGKTENELKNSNYIIKTYLNFDEQNKISSLISSKYSKIETNPNVAAIVINNKTNGIECVVGNKKILETKKQPGSAIKPILVYAPAIEKNIISPATKILDEKININGYSPENADKRYHGFVSARECLKNSYNVPTVKLLNQIGIKEAQNFAKNLGINFDDSDNNLAIALGGFTSGTTLYELANSYTAFANTGKFSYLKLISKIESPNKNTIYSDKSNKISVMSKSTAYLITDMLMSAAKTGTAKKLSNLPYQIASKTGTVGMKNSSKNLEAYNVSYTSSHTILTYVGGTTMPESITGSSYPTLLTKDICELLYKKFTPENFAVPSDVETKQISKTEYEKNVVVETDNNTDSISEVFSKNNLPQKKLLTPNLNFEAFNFIDEKPILSFFTSPEFKYKIMRKEQNESDFEAIETIDPNSSEIYKFCDKTAKNNKIYEYFVKICEKSSTEEYQTKTIKLKSF